jgi:Putative peptidoglycan binding domain
MNRVLRVALRMTLLAMLAGVLLALPAIFDSITSVTGDIAAYAQGGGGSSGGGSAGGQGGMGNSPGPGQGMGDGQGTGRDAQGMEQGSPAMPGQQMQRDQYQTQAMDMNGSIVRGVQRALNQLGYHAGPVDGVMGPRTRSAVADYQAHHGMMADGQLSSDLAGRIQGDAQKN